jgi:hypothetical protein
MNTTDSSGLSCTSQQMGTPSEQLPESIVAAFQQLGDMVRIAEEEARAAKLAATTLYNTVAQLYKLQPGDQLDLARGVVLRVRAASEAAPT